MSQENVEIVRAMYEPMAHGDFGAWADLPDYFEFVASPELPDAGTYRGEAAARWMTAWVESFDGHTIEATEITDAGTRQSNRRGGPVVGGDDASRRRARPGRGVPGTHTGPRGRRGAGVGDVARRCRHDPSRL